jgi:two-component system, sensor histidine kinase and response regulator
MATILVVEDNPVMADGIRDVLELAGHEVFVAGDGVEGLGLMPRVRPDLIISDVMMPRMDGFEFYQAVRANPTWVFVPFIFLTARSQEEDIYLGKRMGADDYLIKPYDRDNLVATVESKLARSRAVSQAAAAEAETLKRSITRVLGHELRTPLTWIQGYAELLLGNAGSMSPEDLEASLQSIKAGSDRLGRLVEDAVLMIMLETDQAKEEYALMARAEEDLLLHIEQVVERMRVPAVHRRVRLELIAPDEPLPPVILAPRFFSEALVRLIDNGIKFARPAGDSYVRINAMAQEREVEIIVADNGVGISPDQLVRIFEPLVQVDRARQEQQGVGLGLTVTRGLIKLHGGRIWAESRMGEGTEVHVTLPQVAPDVDVARAWSGFGSSRPISRR